MGYDKYCSAGGMFVENRTDAFDVHVRKRVNGYDKYCSASGMFVENRADGFNVHVRKRVKSFHEKTYISDSPLIGTVINSSEWRYSRLLQLWEKYSYLP